MFAGSRSAFFLADCVKKQEQKMVLVEMPNPALNLAPFGRWTLRDKAAQRRLALRYAP